MVFYISSSKVIGNSAIIFSPSTSSGLWQLSDHPLLDPYLSPDGSLLKNSAGLFISTICREEQQLIEFSPNSHLWRCRLNCFNLYAYGEQVSWVSNGMHSIMIRKRTAKCFVDKSGLGSGILDAVCEQVHKYRLPRSGTFIIIMKKPFKIIIKSLIIWWRNF